MPRNEPENSRRPSGRRKGPWSHPEIERLKRLYGLKTEAQIARALNEETKMNRFTPSRFAAAMRLAVPVTLA